MACQHRMELQTNTFTNSLEFVLLVKIASSSWGTSWSHEPIVVQLTHHPDTQTWDLTVSKQIGSPRAIIAVDQSLGSWTSNFRKRMGAYL